ncbi:MAG: FtsQ-type POTRA domain-containing protein [Succinivibrionaceae bacterium]|nr:FtsQ-type POTRA domain-containing protein [Succinivibrionaceae bacterium]
MERMHPVLKRRLIMRVAGAAFAGVIIALVVVGDVTIHGILTSNETLPVRRVKVDGAFQQLSARSLAAVAGRMCAGRNLPALDLRPLLDRLRAMPWVAQAAVRKVMPDLLVLSVVEHVPAAVWNGRGFYDARTRSVFYPTEPSKTPRFVRLGASRDNLASDVYESAVLFMGTLKGSGHEMVELTLDEVRCYRMRLLCGTTLIIGRDPAQANLRLGRFLTVVRNAGIPVGEYQYFDLRYESGFAAGPKVAGEGAAEKVEARN